MKTLEVEKISAVNDSLLGFGLGKHKGEAPIALILGSLLVGGVVSGLALGAFSGTKPVQASCQKITGGNELCSSISFQTIGDTSTQLKTYYIKTPSGAVIETDSSGTPLTAAGAAAAAAAPALQVVSPSVSAAGNYLIRSVSVGVQDPQSKLYTAYNGTVRVYSYGTDYTAANANPLVSITVTNGVSGTVTTSNIFTGQKTTVVMDGAAAWYDAILNPYTFDLSRYNLQASDPYGLVVDLSSVSPITPPYRIGTYGVTLSGTAGTGVCINGYPSAEVGNTTGCNTQAGTFGYNASMASGQQAITITVTNSRANSLIKQAVLAPQNSVDSTATAFGGNEFSLVNFQHVQSTNFYGNANPTAGSDLTTAFSAFSPVSWGNIAGGDTGTFTLTFTVVNANVVNNSLMYMQFDDLGGFLHSDALVANKGAANAALRIRAYR